jgi:hypothetical protein
MPRKKLYPVRLTLPLSQEVADQIDASLADGEARLDLIREGIARELKRRARAKGPSPQA